MSADQKILNSLTLLFESKDLNTRFLVHYNTQNVRLIRINLLIGAILYIVFGILDVYMVPDAAGKIFIIRIICTFFLLLMFAVSFSAGGKHIQLMTFLSTLICGLGIILMTLISATAGAYYYYAGLLLVIWYAHGPLRMRFLLASAVTIILSAVYQVTLIYFKTTPFDIAVNNSFFILSANILGMFSSYGLEYYSRIAFWREEQLNKTRDELSSEYTRQAKELEDARNIQLSMLPASINDIPGLDIFFDMRTAAEVGGDYYDYRISKDGSVTLVLGDATGHGMKAGILVGMIKSMFLNYRDETDHNTFLNNCSNTIKSMHLGNLFMSLLMLRYKDEKLHITAAGMPPILVWRAGLNQIERIIIKGIPLGAVSSFDYCTRETEINSGDVVLLMTDGFPELFNLQNETLDYSRVSEIFCKIDKSSSSGIVRQLFEEADIWRGDKAQQDDISFIVFRKM